MKKTYVLISNILLSIVFDGVLAIIDGFKPHIFMDDDELTKILCIVTIHFNFNQFFFLG